MAIVIRNQREAELLNAVIQHGPAIARTALNELRNWAARTRPPTSASSTRAPTQKKKAKQPATTSAPSRPPQSVNNTSYAPVSQARGWKTNPPTFKSRNFMSTRIVHREYIGGVIGTSAFAATAYPLNPGMAQTFPWLSTQASSWEQYKFHKLNFVYYTRCATSEIGSILLTPDYDAADAAPASEIIACSYRDTVEEVPWTTSFACRLDPKAMSGLAPRKYVRNSTLAPNLDVKTYDSGTMYVCTVGNSTDSLGKLFVEYDIELFIPALPPSGQALANTYHAYGGTWTAIAPLENQTGVNGNIAQVTTNVSGVITFNVVGEYFVSYYAISTTSTQGPPVLSASGISYNTGFNANGYSIAGSGTADANVNAWVSVTKAGSTLQLNPSAVTSGDYWDLTINVVQPNIY